MAREYLEKLKALIDQMTGSFHQQARLEYRHFFSGAALYANRKICITLTPVGLALKLPQLTRDKLIQKKLAVPLQYFPSGPVKKEYALIADDYENEDLDLQRYIAESIEYVLSLPDKKNQG